MRDVARENSQEDGRSLTAQVSGNRSFSYSATFSLEHFPTTARHPNDVVCRSASHVRASSSSHLASYYSRTRSRAPLGGAPNADRLRQRTHGLAFPPHPTGMGFPRGGSREGNRLIAGLPPGSVSPTQIVAEGDQFFQLSAQIRGNDVLTRRRLVSIRDSMYIDMARSQ